MREVERKSQNWIARNLKTCLLCDRGVLFVFEYSASLHSESTSLDQDADGFFEGLERVLFRKAIATTATSVGPCVALWTMQQKR